MITRDRIDQLNERFKQLSDDGQEHMLAILQALTFAQSNIKELPPKPANESKTKLANVV